MKRPVDGGDMESFFRSMFTSAPVGVSLASFDGKFMQVNPTLCIMLGYTEKDLNQLGLLAVTHPDDLAAEMRLLDEMRESTRSSYQVEKRCIRADGSLLHTRLTVALARNAAGDAIGGIGFLEDIEHEYRALQMLRESESRFRSLVQNSSDAVLVVDDECVITYASTSCEAVLGWPAHELVGWLAYDLLGFDGIQCPPEVVDHDAMAGAGQIQRLVTGRDGEQRWVEAIITDQRDDPTVSGLVINCRDVSDRVYAYETLLESQERYRTVVDAVHEVVFQADADGRWTFLNSAFEDHTGFKVADALGVNFLEIIHPDDRPANFQVIQAMRQGLLTEGQLEGRYQAKDGSVGLFLGRVRATRDAGRGVVGFAGVIRDVTQTREHESQLSNLSFRDPLTGLANSSLLLDRLDQSLARTRRSSTHVAVIHLGLDSFKSLNEQFGTMAGDTVLAGVAGRLAGVLRGSETVARVGGDEFAIISEGVIDTDAALAVASRIAKVLGEPFMLEGSERWITFGLGVVLESPEAQRAPSEILRDANMAMARAKSRGTNEIELCEGGRQSADDVPNHEALAGELVGALAGGDIVLHYQPLVELETGRIVGFEALVRWGHPTRGFLSPAVLMPIAEAADLDGELAKWAIEQSLTDLDSWQTSSAPLLSMTVNLSARQLARPSVVCEITQALNKANTEPSQFIIDLTERAAVAEAGVSREGLRRLQELGVGISLDDFGSGHSSLLFLRHLPISMVKVDPTFVMSIGADSRDQALVSAVVAMADGLGLVTVAEGVETEDQMAMLRSLGCNQAQGHLFGRPQPAIEVKRLLAERQ
ncbi:MAG: sensor domain-containing protein [Acidimicrobiales bacterium]